MKNSTSVESTIRPANPPTPKVPDTPKVPTPKVPATPKVPKTPKLPIHGSQYFSRFTIALCLACALGVSGVRAQTNTEYSFRQQSVTDGQAFNNNGDPVPELSMDCIASNGYGQWTLTTLNNASYGDGWYLLPNGLYAA